MYHLSTYENWNLNKIYIFKFTTAIKMQHMKGVTVTQHIPLSAVLL